MLHLRIINDIHILGVDPYMSYDEMLKAIKTSPHPVYLAGDVVDLINCKKEDVDFAIAMTEQLFHLGECLSGNHDPIDRIIPGAKREALIWDRILITHGDEASWGVERADKFRSKEFGASWFKRNLVSRPISALRHLLAVRPNSNHLAFVERKKKQYPLLKHIVMGHSHPQAQVVFHHAGVQCIILPQGVNDIGLEL